MACGIGGWRDDVSDFVIRFHRSEKSSKIYSTALMTDIFAEEGKKIFDARSASLGHTLQGGVPSPYDRTRAARLSLRCMQFLETHATKAPKGATGKSSNRRVPSNTQESAASITIQGSAIVFTPVAEMIAAADMKNRRGNKTWWKDMKALVELMGGRTGIVNEE
jgi:6-phosphofructokinase 1